MVRTITCCCGETLRSDDEEELYTFARAHALQPSPEPHRPLRVQGPDPLPSGAASSGPMAMETRKVTVGRDL